MFFVRVRKRGLAERGGFEPLVRFNPYNGLANRRFRPLSHLSIPAKFENPMKPSLLATKLPIVETATGGKEMQRFASSYKRKSRANLKSDKDNRYAPTRTRGIG